MTMGQKLYSLRKERGLTLEEVGNKIGVTTSAVSKWEKGIVTNIPLDKIDALCKLYDVTIQYLWGFTEDKKGEDAGIRLVIDGEVEVSGLDMKYIEMYSKFEEEQEKLFKKRCADYLLTLKKLQDIENGVDNHED